MRLPLISALLLMTALLMIPLTSGGSETAAADIGAASPTPPTPKAACNTVLVTTPLASAVAAATAPTAPTTAANIPTFVNVAPTIATAGLVGVPMVKKEPSPSRVGERFFASPVLGRSRHYHVYLPAGYDDDPSVRYPTLYLLHEIGGNADEWLRYGVREAANSLMGDGAIHPFIIALPHGEQGYWVD